MRKIEKYYDNTEIDLPHKNVKKFIEEIETNKGKAIELGCGAGRDTIYLIKNGWEVIAIDRENVESRIIKKLTHNEATKFRFQKQDFEKAILEENNLIVANFSLPFCSQKEFYKLWEKISDSILPNRTFCWELFWNKR